MKVSDDEMLNYAAVDIGNDGVKPIFNGVKKTIIPNVIADAPENRDLLSLESTLYEGIHCRVTSPALSKSGIFVVGNLATRFKKNHEPEPGAQKSTSDQTVVMLLTTLALEAAKNGTPDEKGAIMVKYVLSTGLPLREAKLHGTKDRFRDRLMGKTHQIEFLQTPEIGGKSVKIEFEEVDVYSEGQAAIMHLATDEQGRLKNEELIQKVVLINDIGGGSTDSAIIDRGELDNENSTGIDIGVSEFLDTIINKVYDKYRQRIRSRRNLVRDVLLAKGERKNHIMVYGKPTDIKDIVDEVLTDCATVQHAHLKRIWKDVSELELIYQIGGGSSLLQPYLTKINEESNTQLPIRWQDTAEESIWMMVESYWKLNQMSYPQTKVSDQEV